jgi:5-methylthioadenosine/S-adenosylhomocysteine deaminase
LPLGLLGDSLNERNLALNTLFKNAYILTMDGSDRIVDSGCVVVADGRIAYVGAEEAVPAELASGRVIDAGGGIVMPGFINAHTHLAMTLLRGYGSDLNLQDWLNKKVWPAEDRLQPGDCYWGSMLGLAEMIRSGTTAFLDMYSAMDETARAVTETGMRAVLTRGMIGRAPNFKTALAENEALYRDFHGSADGRLTVMLGPHAEYTCDEPSIHAVLEVANKLDCGIHVHLQETESETAGCRERYGVSPTEWFAGLGLFSRHTIVAHGVTLDAKDIAILKQYKVNMATCPGSNMKLASGIAPVPELLNAGVNVAVGTDGASSNNNLDMLEETHLAALSAKIRAANPVALSAYRALKMATMGGAVALGIDNNAGSIEVGKDADIIVISTNSPAMQPAIDRISNIVYSANSAAISTTMVNGRILMDNFQIAGIDLEKVYHEANRISERICD